MGNLVNLSIHVPDFLKLYGELYGGKGECLAKLPVVVEPRYTFGPYEFKRESVQPRRIPGGLRFRSTTIRFFKFVRCF